MNEFDVIVVGGGPAGSTAAALCAQRGWSVVLIEYKRFPRHKVCGDVINPNCWPILERVGVAGRVRTLPRHECRGALFTTPGGDSLDLPTEQGLVTIRRSLFDACLLEHARSCGVTVIEGEAVHDIAAEHRVITPQQEYISLKCIVGADGRHSVVARKAGLAGRTANGRGHVALQAHFRATQALDDRVQLHLFPGGYCGVVRIDAGLANLCIVTDPGIAREHDTVGELFARTVERNPQFRALGIKPEPLESLQSVHPLSRRMNVPQGRGVMLVGDALRVVEPFTGQGIFFALRTSELAAQAIGDGGDYARAVRELYRRRGRTNRLLQRLMYRERVAWVAVTTLHRLPAARRWLAANVLAA